MIREFHDVFVANEAFAELKSKKVSLEELQKYPILMLDRKSTTSEFLHSMFQRHQLDLVPEIELSSNDLLIDLAKIGLGIAFVPDYLISEHDDSLFTLDLDEDLPVRQLIVACNENVPISQAAKSFMEML
jgi:DNA-binding transcriptional LysR family regulator